MLHVRLRTRVGVWRGPLVTRPLVPHSRNSTKLDDHAAVAGCVSNAARGRRGERRYRGLVSVTAVLLAE